MNTAGSNRSYETKVKLHCDPDTDSLYIDPADAPAAESQEVRDGVVLDFDADGRLVGIDLDHASRHTPLDQLQIANLPTPRK